MGGDPHTATLRIPLSKERVLREAIMFADTNGIESLSMRKLAQELGVEAMSLYYYVANKEDLLAGMVDLVLSEVALPVGDGDWKERIRTSASSIHRILVQHPWACSLMMSPMRVNIPRLRWMEGILGCLRGAGFSAELTHHAYHALDSHITGFALWLASMPFTDHDELALFGEHVLQDLPIEQYPYIIEHLKLHLAAGESEGTHEFEFGLDLILDGVERMRDRDETHR